MSAQKKIDYIEFTVGDMGAARRFYEAAFGWRFTDYGPAYTSFEDGRLSGGFAQGEAPQAVNPLVVLYAADLEGTQAQVEAAGGAIIKPIFSFPGGRRFHFRDPAGLEMAVWSE